MSYESDYENLSQSEIIGQMKSLMKVLEKKEKAQSKVLAKMEEKKVAAAPAKGVRPQQLDKNGRWVEFVHKYILSNGWESFTHKERMGKGMVDVLYPGSVLTEEKEYVFEGSEEQPNLSHAMTLSKIYKTTNPELYSTFEEEYVPLAPDAVKVKPKAIRVSMTLEEKLQHKREKERQKEQEKAERERIRGEKKAEKEEEKRQVKQAKEMVKDTPKGAVKAVKAVVRPVWVAPVKGELKRVTVNGIHYYVDYLNRAFPPDEQDLPGECVGAYMPMTRSISDDVKDLVYDENDE